MIQEANPNLPINKNLNILPFVESLIGSNERGTMQHKTAHTEATMQVSRSVTTATGILLWHCSIIPHLI